MSDIKNKIIEEIKKIYDPEIPVNIYELGLIYKIEIDKKNNVKVDMTLTTPNCPVADSLPKQVKEYILLFKVKHISCVAPHCQDNAVKANFSLFAPNVGDSMTVPPGATCACYCNIFVRVHEVIRL